MKRGLPALLSLLLSCGKPAPAPFVFPQSVGGWKLQEARDMAPADAPQEARRLGLKRARTARYEGLGEVDAQVYELGSDAAALEMEQTWRPAAETVVFHGAGYFAVIHWRNAGRNDIGAFVRALEKRMSGPPARKAESGSPD